MKTHDGKAEALVAAGKASAPTCTGAAEAVVCEGKASAQVTTGHALGRTPRWTEPPGTIEQEKILLVDADGATLQWARSNNRIAHWKHIQNGYDAPDGRWLIAIAADLTNAHTVSNPPATGFVRGKSFSVGFWFYLTSGDPLGWYGTEVEIYTGSTYLTNCTADGLVYATDWGVIVPCLGTFNLSLEESNALNVKINSNGAGWIPGQCIVCLNEIDIRITCDYAI